MILTKEQIAACKEFRRQNHENFVLFNMKNGFNN